jgi:glycosyltransferase involved in cell wall biosynthesis
MPAEHAARRTVMTSAARPLKVCHLVATTLGATWMFEQLRELRDRHGYDVSAIVNAEKGPLVDLLRSAGIPFHVCDFGLEGRFRAWSLLRATAGLVRTFRAQRFDVVQTHVFLTLLAARPAAWIAGVPVRLAMIAGPFHLEAKASRLVEGLTQWMEDKDRLRLVHYSADTDRFDSGRVGKSGLREEFGWAEDTPVIVLIAYFYPRLGHGAWIPESLHGQAVKGHEDLIRAAPLVIERFGKARFALVGGGFAGFSGYLEECRALVERMGLGEHVVFTGHRSDIGAILRDATVAVQASLCENMGGTLEALAMARPMVATRVGGMVDVIQDGVTGLLAEPRNPQDLARRICEMLEDPERAGVMGRRGRELVLDSFSLARTTDDLNAVYREYLARPAAKKSGYSFALSLARAAFAVGWLPRVWVLATLSGDRSARDTARRFRDAAARLPGRVYRRARLEAHLARAALERWTYGAWTALAPAGVRRLARWMRARAAGRGAS